MFKADNSLIGSSTDGITSGNSSGGGSIGNFIIGLNPDILNNASKEYILVTMYHEAPHAYLSLKWAQLGEAAFQIQFQGLTVNGGRLLAVQYKDHWSMGYGTYVNGLRDAILAFNSGFDPVRAAALAECGIIVLNSAKSGINNQERDTSEPGYMGTKCP